MSNRRYSRRSMVKVVGLGVAAAAAGSVQAPFAWGQSKSGTIRLGSVNSLSGAFARYGQEIQRGVDLAVERVNAKGIRIGDTTYKIEQQVYDDKTDASTSAKLVAKAVTSDGCHMVLAGLGSVLVKASIPVAQRLQFPMMTHWAQVDGVFAGQKGNPYLYGAMPPFSHYYTRLSQMAAGFDSPTVKKAAMITPNDELGVFTANDYFPKDVEKAGLDLVGIEFFPPKSQKYASALERLRRKEPDMLVINCYTPDIIGVFKEMQAVEYFPPVIVVEAPTKLYESIGDAINGVFVPSFWAPTLDRTKDDIIGNSRDFAALYKAKYEQEPPDFVAACGANNIIVYTMAMMAAGSIDDRQKINAAFRAMDGETFFSKVRFGDDGLNQNGEIYPSQFQDGKPRLVYPPDVKTADPIHPYPGYKA